MVSPAPADAVVIGGGIVGLSSAIELAERGRSVVVLDRDEIGAGCGIGSAGHIVPSHVIPLAAPGMMRTLRSELGRRHRALSVAWTLSPSFWAWAVSFLRHCNAASVDSAAPALSELGGLSAELTRELSETADIMYVAEGLLDVYGSQKALDDAVGHADALRSHGVAVEVLDADGTRALEPTANDSVVGSIRFPDDATLRPASLLGVLHDRARDLGVRLVPSNEATGLNDHDGRIVSVETDNSGPVSAKHVVIAAGAWSGTFGDALGERLPVVAARGLSLTVDRPVVSPRRAMLLGEQHVAVAPNRDELRISGWFELGKTSLEPEPHRIRRLEALARTRLDFDGDLTNRRPWAGLRPMTPDGVPIIGPSRRWDNVTVATGHAMTGLSMGLGTGRLVAQLVCDEQPEIDISRFAIERFG